ncbi:TPA: hypothetical protein KML71_004543 [Escherichia coli]|nr:MULTISPECIES: hypothetical protein [Escherichia]EAC1244329.1 hypothetical protein [Salmonella enterica subsp. enterica serovar Aberdeen]EBS9358071.1 hypothetical protein [Salmonella enterica]ECO2990374.1 hypothetical protein [Salmonella enterica subsp. enterica serovar Braenderup]EFX7531759.1 hypothetical protein [Shigella flexneri]EJY9943084.1 hypothetical protein [Shigella sonnei]MED0362783.1 hypothetical protein [Escherichia marmotae]
MMSRNIKMATEVKTWLQARGSHVNESYLGVARPILEITCPPPELVRSAIRIMEHKSGIARSVWTARFNGCQIIWR